MALCRLTDVNLYYEIIGKGPTVVLVHGWGADSTMYDEQKAALSKHFELIVYDHRGHGRSSKSKEKQTYTIDQYADDLRGLLDALKKKKVHVVGHSMGGIVALNFAIRYPRYVNKLILASTFAERRISLGEKIQLFLARFIPLPLIARPFAKSCLMEPDEEQVTRIINYYTAAGKKTLLFSAENFGGINYVKELPSLKMKTLIIHGDEDQAVPYEKGMALHRGITGSKLATIEGAGHSLNWENKDEFNAVIIDFLT
jgi:pimeloyl-ACP methyl ester carboxylesterase